MKYKKTFQLIIVLILLFNTAISQKKCYERIIEEANNIDSLEASTGTGFLINNEGYILTNRHVIENSEKLIVTFYINEKKIEKEAKIISWNKSTDIAIIKIDMKGLTNIQIPYSLKTKEMKLGEKVFTIGYPSPSMLGESIKMTDGLINATSGFLDSKDLYQISTPIQPGNSGSPLFDEKSNLTGVVVSSYVNGQNVNYAIKSSLLNTLLKQKKIVINTIESNKPLKENIKKIQNCICIVKNISKKSFYSEFEYQNEKHITSSNSMFAMQDCSDENLESFFENDIINKDAEFNKIEYNEWINKIFKSNFSKALYYTYKSKVDWNILETKEKFEIFYKIGATENIIKEHDVKFSYETTKINMSVFDVYIRGILYYYIISVINRYSDYDIKKINNLLKYISFLIELNESTKDELDKKENKAILLVNKAGIMSYLKPVYNDNEICSIIKLSKSYDPTVDIWFDNFCK